MKRLIFASLAVTLCAAPLSFASAETVYYGFSGAGNKATYQRQQARSAQPRIACTVVGCIPIKANCHPETGYTFDGMPTGYDVVVCR